ncbi:MAG: lysophospholipid acyltransferase family protein [Pseudomonadota bacterium]
MFERYLRLALVGTIICVLTLVLIPAQLLLTALQLPLRRAVPMWWHRVMRRVLRVSVNVQGRPMASRPLLLVANHQNWLDIVVLGSVMPLCFIAKSEVRGWPGFGWLARLQRTVFVARERRSATGAAVGEIAERMAEGDVMVLFAEGTTSDGNRILPFRSSLLGAAQQAERDGAVEQVGVQTVTVNYAAIRGGASGRSGRKALAWYGDLELLPHMLSVLTMGPIHADVRFGSERTLEPGTNRKVLTQECFTEMQHAFADMTAVGRGLQPN